MCGIVGYIGNKKAMPILIDGLKSLEYRGYDSAGIALVENKTIKVYKEKGRVKNLEDILTEECATKGIAHTRWATHGKPSKINAHPQMDNSENFAVVHNGIIENYQELKKFLENYGYTFKSETDTEVIPNLIHYYYEKEKDFKLAFYKALKDLKGSYAILCVSPKFEGIYIAKSGSPLIIGIGTNEYFVASDIPAVLPYTKDFYFLKDNEWAYVSNDKITSYDMNLKEIKLDKKTINLDANAALKDGYEDYMLKEIYEEPKAISETILGKVILGSKINFPEFLLNQEFLSRINKIYLVACGTAYHAGLASKKAFENLTGITTICDVASEFRYSNPLIDEHTLCIFISQSGETADTIAACKLANEKKATTIAITNVFESSVTRVANHTIYTHAGPEIAVASTKAYVSQVIILIILALYLAENLNTSNQEIEILKKEIIDLPKKIEEILENMDLYKKFAKELANVKDIFYIGRSNDYYTAMEGSLKLKEISYIHSEAYVAGELKHGPIALIDDNAYVLGIITNKDLASKTISNLEEVKTRGAKLLIVTNENLDIAGKLLIIPKCHNLLTPVLAIIPLQVISYFVAKEKGLDVDKPRNLAKSVTVE